MKGQRRRGENGEESREPDLIDFKILKDLKKKRTEHSSNLSFFVVQLF